MHAARFSHLTAHLVTLERKSDPGFQPRLADKIKDKSPGHWVDLDQITFR